MENNQTAVLMTEEEKKAFEAFKAEQVRKEAEAHAAAMREEYKNLVDEEIDAAIPLLRAVSQDIAGAKAKVYENFKTVLEMKGEIFGDKMRSDQKTHTFTNSRSDMRITLGYYCIDDYRDTVEEGIAMVKNYISSLAKDNESKALTDMVLRLLSRDAKGTLKASRIVQLRKVAMDTGNADFMEGVRIIEESYQPAVSKQFVKAEVKDEKGMWRNIPLGMTES